MTCRGGLCPRCYEDASMGRFHAFEGRPARFEERLDCSKSGRRLSSLDSDRNPPFEGFPSGWPPCGLGADEASTLGAPRAFA